MMWNKLLSMLSPKPKLLDPLRMLVPKPRKAVPWFECTIIGIPQGEPGSALCWFLNTYTGDGLAQFPQGVWSVIDLSGLGLPPDTKAVELFDLLIITMGTTQELANFTVEYRPHGDTENRGYQEQVECNIAGSGCRTDGGGLWVPVSSDLKIEVLWNRTTPPQWPTHASYGITSHVTAYAR